MTIEAKVIEDSLAPNGARLTTMQLRYPRFIHAEFMTHRVFSRNASSSRAIPIAKLIAQVRHEPATPVHWGKNQPGMQASQELEGAELSYAKRVWLAAAEAAAKFAEDLSAAGVHKQVANRVLEPFAHISVIVTATEWTNFFALRLHKDAQPEIRVLSERMHEALSRSLPRNVGSGPQNGDAWHLPYVTDRERTSTASPLLLAQLSAARCARVSYLTHDGAEPSQDKDLELYNRLVGAEPLHASPVEHQAYPLSQSSVWCKNFRGWRQFRTDVEVALAEKTG
jgi:thymidylate synthase ThyX